MPWLETAPMEQREKFLRDHQLRMYTVVELSARYGISRKTAYKWLARFDAHGRAGLRNRSRAPHHCPHRIPDAVARLICEARRQHPSWGREKLLACFAPRHPSVRRPAVSTAGDLLARRGLVTKRRRRWQSQHPGVVPPTTVRPNDLWTADFKGYFRTRDGIYCYLLTVAEPPRYLKKDDNDDLRRLFVFGAMFCSTIASRKRCTSLTEIENMRHDSAGQLIAMNAMNAITSPR